MLHGLSWLELFELERKTFRATDQAIDGLGYLDPYTRELIDVWHDVLDEIGHRFHPV